MSNPVMVTTVGQSLLDATIEAIVDKYSASVVDMIDEVKDHVARSGFSEVYSIAAHDYIYDAFVKAGF